MNRGRKYLLTGYLGANNLGDECMLRRFLRLFEPYPQVSFTIFSYGLSYDSGRIGTRYHREDQEERWRELLQASRDVDGVIWVGGNCFTDFDGDGEFRLLLRCKLSAKRFYYAGIGIDEMRRARRRVKAMIALNLADGVIMRDPFSLALGRRWCMNGGKVSFAPDLGELYLRDLDVATTAGEGSDIAVSWRDLQKNLPESHHSLMESLASELALLAQDQGREIVVFHTDDRMDREANRYLVRCLREKGVQRLTLHEDLSLEGKLAVIAAASAVVTARLHTGVSGVLYGKPTAIFNYSKKIEQFAERADGKVLTLSTAEDFQALRQFCSPSPLAPPHHSVGDFPHPLTPSRKGRGDEPHDVYLEDDRVYRELAAELAGVKGGKQ